MRCSECGVTINPPAVLCPGCTYRASQLARMPKFSLATPSPSKTAASAVVSTKARRDISWVTVTLVCLPFLVLGCLIAYRKIGGDPAKMFGYTMGPVIWGAVVAGLLGRFAKARFRLTLMVTFLVMEILPLLNAVSSINNGNVTAASPSSSATEESAVPLPARIDFEWPEGWRLEPAERVDGGVAQRAVLFQNRRPVAAMLVSLGRDGPTRTLSEEANVATESATETIEKAGGTVAWSPSREDNVGNLPAIEREGTIVKGHEKARELMILVDGPDHAMCGLVYTANVENFDGYKPQFDDAVKRFTCRNTSTVASADH